MTTILDYCWAFSTISKATLQGSSSYQIVNFPLQSDQTTPALKWTEPDRENTSRPKLARYSLTVSLKQRGDGFYLFTLGFKFWTPGQMAYVLTNQFGSAQSAPATVQTWDDGVGGFSCFHAEAQRPVPGQDFDIPATDGSLYTNVKIRFLAGVIL